jgi:hypothetical protein
MKFDNARPFADPEIAARKLVEIASTIEPVQDGEFTLNCSTGRFCSPTTAVRQSSLASSSRSSAAGSRCTRAGRS